MPVPFAVLRAWAWLFASFRQHPFGPIRDAYPWGKVGGNNSGDHQLEKLQRCDKYEKVFYFMQWCLILFTSIRNHGDCLK
jgi:hypothetical protein